MASRRVFLGGVATTVCAATFGRTAQASPVWINFEWRVPPGFIAAGTLRKAFIVLPPFPKVSRRAVCYFPTFWQDNGWNLPEHDEPNMLRFIEAGLFVVGLDQGDTFGVHRSEWWAFTNFVRRQWSISAALTGWGRSRGGMWSLNLAADGLFDRIACCAPITDGRSYAPAGIAQIYTGEKDEQEAIKKFAGMHPQNVPNARVKDLISTGVAIAIVYGGNDNVVPSNTNTMKFRESYIAAGGKRLTTFFDKGGTHEMVTKTAYKELIDFVVRDEIA